MVDVLEEEGREGRLNELMVFFMTDNITVECVVDKGYTPSRTTFEHVLRIKRTQFKFKFFFT